MGRYWNDKTNGVDYINAEDFNRAFSLIEADLKRLADSISEGSSGGGTSEGSVLIPIATTETLGGIKIGENLSAELDGTATVKTAVKITADSSLPARADSVYEYTDSLAMTDEEIDAITDGVG